ncbi:MAG: hypothetical protein AAFU85_07685, partial [Planctomycetota bacterium]
MSDSSLDRRRFLQATGAAAVATSIASKEASLSAASFTFSGPDSLCLGAGWETLNPGYWQIKEGALRRRILNYGDRARSTGFPFHYETHQRSGGIMPLEYDPSLPAGIVYRNDWKLSGAWSISGRFTYQGEVDVRRDGDSEQWKMYQPGYGRMGLAFGAKNLLESYSKARHVEQVCWSDDGKFGFVGKPGKNGRKSRLVDAPKLKPGESVTMRLSTEPVADYTKVTATLQTDSGETFVVSQGVGNRAASGYVGVVGRGLTDFSVNAFEIEPQANTPLKMGNLECHVCYPLGDTLQQSDGDWRVRFVALFASDGEHCAIRIADQPDPPGGWDDVPVAGSATIVNHQWRRNTAVINATLPANPATKTQYYTIWKDGRNVTADGRVGTDATGPGTGRVGDVPDSGSYVGRLPQLAAPYKVCGLSCHAITSGLQQRSGDGWKMLGGGDDWMFRDQPTVEAYKHLEAYDFQIMCWEDDVWYMELVLYPPSTDDAYKVITETLCGPTARWQMMRHWNVINPGDHDYGMDDV